LKKFAVIVIVTMVLFSSCTLTSIFNPIVGVWENTTLGVTTNYDFNANGTSVGTVTVLSVGVSSTGTWSSDSTALTMTWLGSSDEQVDLYSFSEGNTIMTLTPEGGGLVREFTRQ
jgi:hypothetical protein